MIKYRVFSQRVAMPVQELAWHWWQEIGGVLIRMEKAASEDGVYTNSSSVLLMHGSQTNFKS